MTGSVLVGDCRAVLRAMAPSSVDAVVTDPPYGLSFMGKGWDHGVPGVDYWQEVLRVLRPGGHIVAFGGTRTYHRLTCAIEDAGFEIRDCLQWLYGSGFPKSHNVSIAIDKQVGGMRHRGQAIRVATEAPGEQAALTKPKGADKHTPQTPEAQQWEGWGTALKPAWEPVILARRPFKGSVARNVLEHGTGALNIDGCRVSHAEQCRPMRPSQANIDNPSDKCRQAGRRTACLELKPEGRWPANLILDPEAGEALDAQTGQEASRFFYCAKASRSEREAGLAHRQPETVSDGREVAADNAYQRGKTERLNIHSTVKPIDLMAYLCRLITPPGGAVLDPFCGSGSTGCAAVREGFKFIGVELDPEYAEIARARIAHHGQLDRG